MNLCEKTKDLLVLFAEDELTSEEKVFVQKHLEVCEYCKAELAKYQSIIKNLTVEDYSLPASYSSELIVNINKKIDRQKAYKIKLVPAISFATVLLFFAVSLIFNMKQQNVDTIFTEEYLLYEQYSGSTYFDNSAIYEETAEIVQELMPKDYISSSQEYLLENSENITESYSEVLSQLDDEAFNEIINNLKNIEI